MKTTIIFALAAIFLFLAGCEQASTDTAIAEEDIQDVTSEVQIYLQLDTDKELYHSNEMMNITLHVTSDIEMNNATARVYGIYAGSNRLDLSKTADIKEGENTIYFEFRTPPCNRCSGISAGNYTITAEIEKDVNKIVTSKSIDIQQ
jgi:hypothetical protein